MAEYLIELAQLARLLNPPLENRQFLDMAIQHFPQEVRSALIVAKPANFSEAVTLLKQLQGRKNLERANDFSVGPQNLNRRPNNRQHNFQSPGAGADAPRPTGSAQTSNETHGDSSQVRGSPPIQSAEWTNQGHQSSNNNWRRRGSGPNHGHGNHQGYRQEVADDRGGNGRFNGRPNGGQYSNRAP